MAMKKGGRMAEYEHRQDAANDAGDEERSLVGVVAEFDTVEAVMAAAKAVRDAGYKYFDVHSPFPIHGIDAAMGIKTTVLPWIVLICGLGGIVMGLTLTIYTMGSYVDIPAMPEPLKGYEYLVSGKPHNSLPAWIPVVFECCILFSAFGAVFGMFLLNRLPLLYHPVFRSGRFRRVTDDRFFVFVESRDEKFDADDTAKLLRDKGALSIEQIED
jgi:hypothetical protein